MKPALYLVLALSVGATSNAIAESEKCNPDAYDTRSMAICGNARAKALDDRLNQLSNELIQRLQKEESRGHFNAAQDAWAGFIEKDCIYSASGVRGGSLYPLSLQACEEAHKEQRVLELERFLSCTDAGCPE